MRALAATIVSAPALHLSPRSRRRRRVRRFCFCEFLALSGARSGATQSEAVLAGQRPLPDHGAHERVCFAFTDKFVGANSDELWESSRAGFIPALQGARRASEPFPRECAERQQFLDHLFFSDSMPRKGGGWRSTTATDSRRDIDVKISFKYRSGLEAIIRFIYSLFCQLWLRFV
ncbi:MAG: hypothetical protein AB7F41_04855 [Methylocystis sp.]|uniref:hypothetical protein n=1 Tax=Methylocystis sp. TaxID=1911079 RepID=UPI003D0CA9E2